MLNLKKNEKFKYVYIFRFMYNFYAKLVITRYGAHMYNMYTHMRH